MFKQLGQDLRTVVVAVVAASVVAGPTAAAAVYVANADKVDNKHAVASGATVKARKGKLVATNGTTGRLPNNIIAKALDADRLDGKDSAAFVSSARVLTAVVRDDGTLARGSGVVSTGKLLPTVPNRYRVVFNRDVRACTYAATVGEVGREVTHSFGEVSVASLYDHSNGVFVETRGSTGDPYQLPFHLVVYC